MKRLVFLTGAALASLATHGNAWTPQVSDVAMTQHGDVVTVAYTLDAPAIVTADFLTNGVSIGGTAIGELAGDASRLVSAAGRHTFSWKPSETWYGEGDDSRADVTVKVTAWSRTEGPDYLVVDLAETSSRRLSFYERENLLPFGGLTNDLYRTTRLVMRRIPAKNATFAMGCSPKEPSYGRQDFVTVPARTVSLTNDFYLGVFEATMAQVRTVFDYTTFDFTQLKQDTTPPYTRATNGLDAAATTDGYPMSGFSYVQLRENMDNGRSPGNTWPDKGHAVKRGAGRDNNCSVLGYFRDRTGLLFDLPTEAEWEFACRAGTTSDINDGTSLYPNGSSTEVATRICDLGWIQNNSGTKQHVVGQKRPNAWGLYDMHGNAMEYCLDWYAGNVFAIAGELSPIGPAAATSSAEYRVRRGGHATHSARAALSYARHSYKAAEQNAVNGFRLWCPAEF